VLSRYAHEQILIGDDIRIEIVAVRGKKVRLLIEAPVELSIVRGEVAQAVAAAFAASESLRAG